MVVAIEHESNHRGFESEIMKLLSVRCPVKLGITYTPFFASQNTEGKCQQVLNDIHEVLVGKLKAISQVVDEDPKTEYLFLVGAEEQVQVITWYACSFSAQDVSRGLEIPHFSRTD